MSIKRLILRLPVLNILFFTFMPKTAYSEYLLWIMEENDLTMEQLWVQLTDGQKNTLREFGLSPSEKISSQYKKEDEPSETGSSEAQSN